jgi:hypothetical protein
MKRITPRLKSARAYHDDALARVKHLPCEEVYAGLKWLAREGGYKPGWIAFKFKELFHSWPNRMDGIPAEPPSVELQEWVYRAREKRSAEYSREKARLKRQAAREQPMEDVQ